MELIIATHNDNKVKEIKDILGGYFDKISSAKDAGVFEQVDEDGATFFDNALKKAQALKKLFPSACVLSDDSGLCVDALGGAPSINSNRFAVEGNDKANRDKLLAVLQGVTDRSARFVCCVVLIDEDGKVYSAQGETSGEILRQEQGSGGFGYDCVFFSDDLKTSFGAASKEQKNSVSHRGRALNNLYRILLKNGFFVKSNKNKKDANA